MSAREQELDHEKSRLASDGRKEQQTKVREMEAKLETLFRDFEYHAREAVNAVQDRAAAQKLSKDAERRIAKMRREFREQFDSTVVAPTRPEPIAATPTPSRVSSSTSRKATPSNSNPWAAPPSSKRRSAKITSMSKSAR